MNIKYQTEINEFAENFKEYRSSRIVLYGIGRYTATLLEGLKDFNFVGLMDKDSANIGKEIFGLPIMDMHTVEKEADIVVINTSETYWDVIYERIKQIEIPVFYKNGQKAEIKSDRELDNPYKDLHVADLISEIESADIISFDFFDTLFMRKECNPGDVFELLTYEIKDIWTEKQSYIEVRNSAKKLADENYDLDELYSIMSKICKTISPERLNVIKNKEIELEKNLLVPRKQIIDIVKQYCKDKELYITTDMYLPPKFFDNVLHANGITDYKLLLSCKEKKSKAEGTLFDLLLFNAGDKKVLHVGDNIKADIEIPKSKGIHTYHIPSAWDMLKVSKLAEQSSKITTFYDSLIMGMVLADVFNSPFAYEESFEIRIIDCEQMGYTVFGPVILTFLLWLKEKSNDERLIFMSRDGYFLKEDYDLLENTESDYIYISRQLAMTAAANPENMDEILEYASMPYSGNISELIEDRFGGLQIEESDKQLELPEILDKYKAEIVRYISTVKNNYIKYLGKFRLNDKCSVVDLSFYGNNQKYLNKLVGVNMKGYYFNANLSPENPNTVQPMYACFQTKEDTKGEQSEIFKKLIFIESFLTAPHGMIKAVDEAGNMICAPNKNNQHCFDDKRLINNGVKRFIEDYKNIISNINLIIDTEFVDKYYGMAMKAFKFSDAVKKSFYNDNAMMNRIESMLFY